MKDNSSHQEGIKGTPMAEVPAVAVIGAGISGIRAALDLAESGRRVYLIEKAPAVGGILNQLDHQFPDNHCGMCRMLPMLERDAGSQFCVRKGVLHDQITLLPRTTVAGISGSAGRFSLSLKEAPGGVDLFKCIACGKCEAVCPVEVADPFNAGLGKAKAIRLAVPYQPRSRFIDREACTRCGACVAACPAGAVDLEGDGQSRTLANIAAVIVASGVPLFDPERDPAASECYGWGILPNVVTATGFERLLSGSGPTGGKLLRPSDGRAVRRIAWLQCVGSRNLMLGADYCSSACCMFAVKEAILAREVLGPEGEAAIFYMDMRTFGRDHQRYRDRAEQEHGVRFVRCRVHSIEKGETPGDLAVGYVDASGRRRTETFDLVVLATGRDPSRTSHGLPPEVLQQEGIFMVDAARGLADISQAVIGAHQAAAGAEQLLPRPPAAPGEGSPAAGRFFAQRPRVAAVLCPCPAVPDGDQAVAALEKALGRLPGEVAVIRIKGICTEEGLQALKTAITTGSANRFVVGICNPGLFLSRLPSLLKETGLPPSLLEVVGIYPQAGESNSVLWRLETAVNRLRTRRPGLAAEAAVQASALVVGGGPAGLAAAAQLAGAGVQVSLVEKQTRLGGNLPNIRSPENRRILEELIGLVSNHPHVDVHLESEVVASEGITGNFSSRLHSLSASGGADLSVRHGAVILATGGRAAPLEILERCGHERIISLFELEKQVAAPEFSAAPLSCVAMIQCVESRQEPRNYCSRICCPKALETALRIREMHPRAEVYIFYRDMMTYGESETLYTEARRRGIRFVPYPSGAMPEIHVAEGAPVLEGWDPLLQEKLTLRPDWISLAGGLVPAPVASLRERFGFRTTRDGFIKEADPKWRPVDTGREGVFVCGLARNPVRLDEALAEGTAAARRALRLLAKGRVRPSRVTATVRRVLCTGCEACLPVCPYGARFLDDDGKAAVDPFACQGCGACAAACPSSACLVGDFEDQGVMAVIEAALYE